ncbi:MAG: hypothetical protein FWH35_03035 [Treponema sp.]|nr:hypothetical protein [Treponema sp.]
MRYRQNIKIILFSIILAACKNSLARPVLRPVLPELPAKWAEILGEAHWRLEWIGEEGNWRETEILPRQGGPELTFNSEWATPVLAWPFWPEKGMAPGTMRPCGAIFPWDVSGETIKLFWEGGVEAIFWKELAAADHSAAAGRLPWNFDWLRFRELLYESENIPDALRENPWLADWEEIGKKTVLSGFDRRRLKPRQYKEFTIPGLGGYWINSSPFAVPLKAQEDGSLVLKVSDVTDTWVSGEGILKCSTSGWVLRKFPARK